MTHLTTTLAAEKERFQKSIPQTDDAMILEKKEESNSYYFGYKRRVNDEIFTVTDWGHIAKFLTDHDSAVLAALQKDIEELGDNPPAFFTQEGNAVAWIQRDSVLREVLSLLRTPLSERK